MMTKSGTHARLARAMHEHGCLTIRDMVEAAKHGADAGWGGFTYISEAAEFYQANRRDIRELAADMADDMGYDNPEAMAANFKRADMLNADPDQADNLWAWFALEEVGRWLESETDGLDDDELAEFADELGVPLED